MTPTEDEVLRWTLALSIACLVGCYFALKGVRA